MDSHAQPDARPIRNDDLYPHFTTDEHGNIIARSNGHTTTIVHANRYALRPGWIRLSGHEGRHADADASPGDGGEPGRSAAMDAPGTQVTIDETHAHGDRAELIFLLRAFEERCRRYEQLLKLKEDENAVLAAWNRTYHQRLTETKASAR